VSLTVHVHVPPGEAELAGDVLWRAGAVAIEERAGVLVAGTIDGDDPSRLLAAVAGRWPAEPVAVDLDAALDAWRAHARAVTVGRLLVRPPWVEPPPSPADGRRRDVVIDPGRAFGHGAHPTTRLVLAALDELVAGGERVLDVGCGSGVLAVAALALGAGTAVGVDTDPAAVAATYRNAARNGLSVRLTVATDVAELAVLDATGRGPDAYDLVVANMLRADLATMAPVVAAALAPAGTAVLSGALVDQRADVVASYGAVGLAPVAERSEHGWLGLILRAG
jgi:ribosomal protein L11 methyltransferase